MELTKNRARAVSKAAQTEKQRLAVGGRWCFTDSFNTTSFVDMSRTTAWIDTSEGIVFLPALSSAQTVPSTDITVLSHKEPVGGSLLGSSPQDAFDSMDSTNWRCAFQMLDTQAECTIGLRVPADINAIQVDPVGFGLSLTIEVKAGSNWTTLVKDVLYEKHTYAVGFSQAQTLRFVLEPTDSSLPRVVGLKNVILFSSQTAKAASLYTQLLKPQYAFNELKLETGSTVPPGTRLTTYYSTASGGPWALINPGQWTPLNNSLTLSKVIDNNTARVYNAGLYYVALANQAINNIDGVLDTGINQLEVSCFKRDWTGEGESPKILSPDNFAQETLLKTWINPITFSASALNSPVLLQQFGGSTLSTYGLTRGNNLVANRKLDSQPFAQMCIVPYTGNMNTSTLQPSYNYRMRLYAYCTAESFYDQSKYFFVQGFRVPGKRTYREMGKTYGAFALYINGQLVASDNLPYTAFSDGSLEAGASFGRPYSIRLAKGWNQVELYLNVLDTSKLISDPLDTGDPYLQLCLMPSFFDTDFQRLMSISKLLGSGETRPSSEFDLLWNLPQDTAFWGWSDDRQAVVFNSNRVIPVDGFLRGQLPRCLLRYTSVDFTEEASDLYLRVDLEGQDLSNVGPIFDEYRVMVR
jgi:hypothetical protein